MESNAQLPPWQFNGGNDVPADMHEYGETVRDRIDVMLDECWRTVEANNLILDHAHALVAKLKPC
jgi:hypothetical protein